MRHLGQVVSARICGTGSALMFVVQLLEVWHFIKVQCSVWLARWISYILLVVLLTTGLKSPASS